MKITSDIADTEDYDDWSVPAWVQAMQTIQVDAGDSEHMDTGLIDKHGNPITKTATPRPVGFCR